MFMAQAHFLDILSMFIWSLLKCKRVIILMQDIRYIENPFFKIFNIINPDHTQIYALLVRLLQKFFKDIKLPTITSACSIPQKSQVDISAYTGTAGYLYGFIRLYWYFSKQSEKQSDLFSSKSHIVGDELLYKLKDPNFYLNQAEEQYKLLSETAEKQKKTPCYSFFMSHASIWLCGMHIGFIKKDLNLFRRNQEKLLKMYAQLQANLQKTQWELLYGVPGFLFTILQAQKAYDNALEPFKTHFSQISRELTDIIITNGVKSFEGLNKTKVDVAKLPQNFRLVYLFYKKQYLGGAHGLGGNLNIILSAIKYNDFGPKVHDYLALIKPSVIFLLKHLINGNFATSAGSQKIKLVHFCHGAPGIVTALAKYCEVFPESGIQMGIKQVIQVNLDHIWKFGVLKKGFGLCHGISGNAYSFISPSVQQVLHQKSDEYLKKAQLFTLLHEQKDVMKEIRQYKFQDRHVTGLSDEPYSMMTGVMGDIIFTIDVLSGGGLFPGYDL